MESPGSDDGKDFNREVDELIDRTGPPMPGLDAVTALLIGEELAMSQTSTSGDEKEHKNIDSKRDEGSKADFTVEQYNLYLQYCDIFESSIKDLISTPKDQDDLYNILSDALQLMQTDGSDDSLAAVFLEMVEAMSDFHVFYSMMYEAFEAGSSIRK